MLSEVLGAMETISGYIMSKTEIGQSKIIMKRKYCSLHYFQFDQLFRGLLVKKFDGVNSALHHNTKLAVHQSNMIYLFWKNNIRLLMFFCYMLLQI